MNKTFKLEIEIDNAVFGDTPNYEVARILKEVAHAIHYYGKTEGICLDYNGNKVGVYALKMEE